MSCDEVPPVPKSRCWLNYPDLASVHLCPNYVRFSSVCSEKKSWATPLISDYLCPLFLFQIFSSHWLKAHTRLFFSSFHVHNAACIDVHSKTLSGLPVLIIGLSAELAKVPHLAIDWHFPTTSADEPARVFDKHLYPNWLWLCGFCGFSSVLWEPMGDGKRVISLADNHALLWDLQESSTRATVRE